MTLWAVVPVKGLDASKGRLAPLLTPFWRSSLVMGLMIDVLNALRSAPEVERVLVVSPDPQALAIADGWGAKTVAEPVAAETASAVGDEAALNAALNHAAVLATQAGAAALLALPADLPLVTPADVAALAAALPPAPSIVVAPTADGGTGALLRQPPLAVPARFGPESVRAHLQAARERGVSARLLWRENLSLDVDCPADVERLMALPRASQTQSLLAKWRHATSGRPTPAATASGRSPR